MESPATMTDNHEVGDKEENNVSEAYFDEVMLVIMKRVQWRLQSTTESVIMNKAETGESSLDDTVAVPAKEVTWGCPPQPPSRCPSPPQLISLHLTSEKQFTPVTVEKRTVYLVYQHRPQPAEADVG